MIDEKGRLFGKINIVDLLVILVIWALVAILNRVTGKKKDDPSGSGKG